MTDIVLKLKDHYAAKDTDAWMSCIDAADEIERLRAEMAGDKILEDCEMHDPVWAAIAGVWGKRCEDFEEGCPCCRAWAEYDKVTRLTAENERLLAANRDVMLHWDVLKADYDKLRAALEATSSDCKEAFADNESLRLALEVAANDLDDWGAYTKANNARAALEGK